MRALRVAAPHRLAPDHRPIHYHGIDAAMTATTPEPQRQSAAERYHEFAMAAIQHSRQRPEFKIELSWNAKGDTQIAVVGSGDDLEALGAGVEAEYDRLRAKYPRDAALPKGVGPTTKKKGEGPSNEVPF